MTKKELLMQFQESEKKPTKPELILDMIEWSIQETINAIPVSCRMTLMKLIAFSKRLLLLSLLISLCNCAAIRVGVKYPCPKEPVMLLVEVHDGTVSGQDLTNAIENNQTLWQSIHLLEKLGCRAK